MKLLLEYINNSDDTDVEVLVNFHRWFMMIHPFYDANGRTARLICTFIALTPGYPGFLLNTITKEEYETVFHKSLRKFLVDLLFGN